MVRSIFLFAAAAGAILAFSPAARSAAETLPPLPSAILPDAWGVNIHFTDPRPGEMEMLAQGGFKWIRMDFNWAGIEKQPGIYDFSAYDRLMKALEPHHIRALFILDYSNKLYDNGLSPQSEEGRQAFARWAAAAVRHFRGQGILWEMYNEPNISFWKPHPDVSQYTPLALAVGKAIRQAEPSEVYIGPAVSTFDFNFLEACFKAGLLEYWSAVSLHPYRGGPPETVEGDYRRLRLLIARYAPKGKRIPIISGEWGYACQQGGMSEETQGKFLPRQWLTNISSEVPLSIWYVWHDDWTSPTDPESHFGTVHNPFRAGQDPVYEPKQAYISARTLTGFVSGFRFTKRLWVGAPEDYVLLFSKGDEVRLAAWTSSKTPRQIVIPASPGDFDAVSHQGLALPALTADMHGLSVSLTDAPLYLTPAKPNDLLRIAAAWDKVGLEIPVAAPARVPVTLKLENPLSHTFRVVTDGKIVTLRPGAALSAGSTLDVQRTPDPKPLTLTLLVDGMGKLQQQTDVIVTNPLQVVVQPIESDGLPVRLENPSGDAFAGTLKIDCTAAGKTTTRTEKVKLADGKQEQTAYLPVTGPLADYTVAVLVTDADGRIQLNVPARHFQAYDDFSRFPAHEAPADYALVADGSASVASEQALTADSPPEGPPSPGLGVLKLTYRYDAGWKFVRVAPKTEALKKIDGQPRSLGIWVYGDGEKNALRLRFIDREGQTFQPGVPDVTWKGWRYVEFAMTGKDSFHYGGPDDGIVHYPITLNTFILLDSAGQKATSGTIYLSGPTWIE